MQGYMIHLSGQNASPELFHSLFVSELKSNMYTTTVLSIRVVHLHLTKMLYFYHYLKAITVSSLRKSE